MLFTKRVYDTVTLDYSILATPALFKDLQEFTVEVNNPKYEFYMKKHPADFEAELSFRLEEVTVKTDSSVT